MQELTCYLQINSVPYSKTTKFIVTEQTIWNNLFKLKIDEILNEVSNHLTQNKYYTCNSPTPDDENYFKYRLYNSIDKYSLNIIIDNLKGITNHIYDNLENIIISIYEYSFYIKFNIDLSDGYFVEIKLDIY